MNDKNRDRLLNLAKDGDYGICPPPMDANMAFNELCNFFLGADWYCAMPVGHEQVITEALYEIENIYGYSLKRKRIVKGNSDYDKTEKN